MSKKDCTSLMIKILQSRAMTTVGQYCLKDHLQNSLETAKGKQDCLCEAHWVPPSPLPPRFNQTLYRWLRLSLESIHHLKHCIWFPTDTQEKAVCDVNIKASWRVAVPILLLPFSHHIREGLISLWYLHVDDRAEPFFQPILWDKSKAITQIPGENYMRFSWFYELPSWEDPEALSDPCVFFTFLWKGKVQTTLHKVRFGVYSVICDKQHLKFL